MALPAPATRTRAAPVKRHSAALVAAQLLTVPAFYLSMAPGQGLGVGRLLYLAAAVCVLAGAWWYRRGQGPHAHRPLAHWWPDALLAAALAACALAPVSDAAPAALALRLATALAGLAGTAWALHGWLRRGSLGYLLASALLVLLMCGMGFWWLEPKTPTLADGLWLAFTTAATVGYGDVVPTTPASKVFAVFVVLLGYSVLSLVTAAIAARWVEDEERRIEHEVLRSLHAEIGDLRAQMAELKTHLAQAKERRGEGG